MEPLYRPLALNEIRLIRILPPRVDSDLVTVELETAQLESQSEVTAARVAANTNSSDAWQSELEYAALSYCWGDPQVTRPVRVNGRIVQVTVNLEAALRQLRHDVGEGRLWVDAICINQDDLAERAQQVSIMFWIYQGAFKVHIWLGELDNLAMDGMRLLELILKKRTGRGDYEHDWSSEQQRCDGIEALARLCRAPYWERMWIVQEVSGKGMSTQETRLHLGTYSFALPTWMAVHGVAGWLADAQDECKEATGLSAQQYQRLQVLDEAIQVIDRAFNPMVIATWGFATNQILASGDIAFARFVPTLIMGLRKSFATDPRDKIYGMLGLLPGAMELSPDYNSPTASVYCEATVQVMKITKTLFLTHQACSGNDDLPTWVPDYSRASRMPPTFVHEFETFNADGVMSLVFERRAGEVLCVNGLHVDTVSHVAGCEISIHPVDKRARGCSTLSAWRTFYKQHCLSTPAKTYTVGSTRYMPFWRTVCLTSPVSTRHGRATFEDRDTAMFEAAFSALRHGGQVTDDERSKLDQMYGTISEHDFFVTAAGRIGMVAPETASPDDKILILASAHCPFIAREALAAGERAYTLQSPCYVDGEYEA